MTVTHAPGLTAADVTITGPENWNESGFNEQLVEYKDVTLTGGILEKHKVWVDGDIISVGAISAYPGGIEEWWVTDSSFTGIDAAIDFADLVRNVTINNCTGHALTGTLLNAHVLIANQSQPDGSHANFYSSGAGDISNIIVDDLQTTAAYIQSFQINMNETDVAVANSTINSGTWYALPVGSTAGYTYQNVYWKNNAFIGSVGNYGFHGTTIDTMFEQDTLNGNLLTANNNYGIGTPAGIYFSNSSQNQNQNQNQTPSTYTVTATAGSNGTISPSGIATVSSGGSQAYTITPSSGYQINAVTVDGVSAGTAGSYTFFNVTANHTISVTFSAVQSAPPPAQPSGPSSGLVGYWKFDEGSGSTVSDSSGNGNTAQLGPSVAWVAGKFNDAVSLDGTANSNITVGSTGSGGLPTVGPLSISAWVNYPVGGSGMVFSADNAGSGAEDYYLTAYGFCSTSASNGVACLSITPPTSGWHSLVAVASDTQVTLYLDNVPFTSTSFNGYGSHGGIGGVDVDIGSNGNGTPQVMSGALDDVRIYNRALSAGEVAQIYNGALSYHEEAQNPWSLTASVYAGFHTLLHLFGL